MLRILYELYKEEKNLFYLMFFYSILLEVLKVNKLFEYVSADKMKLLDDLTLLRMINYYYQLLLWTQFHPTL